MTLILDTNVLSELMLPRPSPKVLDWFSRQDGAQLFTTALSEAELRRGVLMLPEGARRTAPSAAVDRAFSTALAGKVLPFGSRAAGHYAEITAGRKRAGRPISTVDAQIAAVALAEGAAVVTRNVRDFAGCGVDVIDPWAA